MDEKILLLGSTGKMGTALLDVLSDEYVVEGKNTAHFDASDHAQVRDVIETCKPDIVINAVAFLGIDPCEKNTQKAFQLNALYPKLLAELSEKHKYLLIHFSTDAVFDNDKRDFYLESDIPCPLNMYGSTKYNGDWFIQILAKSFYIIRISVLFGETQKQTQFVEKMLARVKKGEKRLRISHDIISSPTYSRDVAMEVKRIIKEKYPYGIYHVANDGKASLCDLMKEIVNKLGLEVIVDAASYKDFPHVGIKNVYTPIKSEKIKALRPWQDAVSEYCRNIKKLP